MKAITLTIKRMEKGCRSLLIETSTQEGLCKTREWAMGLTQVKIIIYIRADSYIISHMEREKKPLQMGTNTLDYFTLLKRMDQDCLNMLLVVNTQVISVRIKDMVMEYSGDLMELYIEVISNLMINMVKVCLRFQMETSMKANLKVI